MSDLVSLSGLKGVVAALRFYDDGTLAEAAGQLDQIDMQLAAELCYANGRIMHHGSDVLMTLSGTAGWPPWGWMMMGNELSVCGVAEVACFVRNREASLNDVFRGLAELSKK
jgi:roadblock/LC7 domain-containing protein